MREIGETLDVDQPTVRDHLRMEIQTFNLIKPSHLVHRRNAIEEHNAGHVIVIIAQESMLEPFWHPALEWRDETVVLSFPLVRSMATSYFDRSNRCTLDADAANKPPEAAANHKHEGD